MLILTRRPAETIYIGEEVTVTVLGVVGNQVRFGIDAPRSIVIDRAEIHERKKRAAQLANGNAEPDEEAVQSEVNGNLERTNRATVELRPRSTASPIEGNGNFERPREPSRIEARSSDEVNGNVALKRR